jgi:hypothetical protein
VGLEGLLWHTAWQAAHSGGAVHSPVCPQNGLGQDAPPVLHQYTAETGNERITNAQSISPGIIKRVKKMENHCNKILLK